MEIFFCNYLLALITNLRERGVLQKKNGQRERLWMGLKMTSVNDDLLGVQE